jgi:hypothetical protein
VNTLRSQIPAYRANVVAYLVAYLAHRLPGDLDFYNVWERQALPPAVANTILSWAEPVYREIARSAGGMNVTEWCKKPACWAAIRDLDLSFDDGCLEYVLAETVAPGDGVESADDANAVSEVLRLTPDDWKSVQEWVTRAEDLHYKMPGIVSTLARMAFKGWPKRPSVKQARAAFSVIERWRVDQDRSLADLR